MQTINKPTSLFFHHLENIQIRHGTIMPGVAEPGRVHGPKHPTFFWGTWSPHFYIN